MARIQKGRSQRGLHEDRDEGVSAQVQCVSISVELEASDLPRDRDGLAGILCGEGGHESTGGSETSPTGSESAKRGAEIGVNAKDKRANASNRGGILRVTRRDQAKTRQELELEELREREERKGLGKRLRRAMLESNTSLQDLAEMSGISMSHLSRMRHGRVREVKSKTLMKIATILGISVDSLLFDRNTK